MADFGVARYHCGKRTAVALNVERSIALFKFGQTSEFVQNFARHLQSRLQMAVNVLNDLGGLPELEQRNGAFYIQGYSCPLAAVVPGHPEVCHLAEALLSELVGLAVKECCEGNEPARCCFSVSKS